MPRPGQMPRGRGLLAAALLLLAAAAAVVPRPARALRFYIKDRERMCFYVSARHRERLQGEATLENGRGTARLGVEIATEDGHVLFDRHDAKIGVFSVVTPPAPHNSAGAHGTGPEDPDDYDPEGAGGGHHHPYDAERKYKACVLLTVDPDPALHGRVQRAVSFRLRPADRADDYAGEFVGGHADHKKANSVSFALDAMLSQLHGMAQDLTSLQSRELSLVAHNKSTAKRLTQFTVLSLIVLVATASFQYKHYKSFFTAKKLC